MCKFVRSNQRPKLSQTPIQPGATWVVPRCWDGWRFAPFRGLQKTSYDTRKRGYFAVVLPILVSSHSAVLLSVPAHSFQTKKYKNQSKTCCQDVVVCCRRCGCMTTVHDRMVSLLVSNCTPHIHFSLLWSFSFLSFLPLLSILCFSLPPSLLLHLILLYTCHATFLLLHESVRVSDVWKGKGKDMKTSFGNKKKTWLS